MRYLVLGGSGIVGRAVVAEAARRGVDVTARSREETDITSRGEVARAIAASLPDLVVNCAAFTAVDRCESEPERAFAVNGEAVGVVAEETARSGARLIHLSTDYVFDGSGTEPYAEDHPTAPRSVYGASKLAGEERALARKGSLVVRTSWIFGSGGPNFVDAIAGKLRAGERSLRVVADQRGGPTYAPFLASALLDLGEWGVDGIVHYQNRPVVSWFELAASIARELGSGAEVVPVSTAEVPRPAPRPAYSVLSVERFERRAARSVEAWSEGLKRHLAERDKGVTE